MGCTIFGLLWFLGSMRRTFSAAGLPQKGATAIPCQKARTQPIRGLGDLDPRRRAGRSVTGEVEITSVKARHRYRTVRRPGGRDLHPDRSLPRLSLVEDTFRAVTVPDPGRTLDVEHRVERLVARDHHFALVK